LTLAKRVKFWAKRLEPLGLRHWQIEVECLPEVDEETNKGAEVRVSRHYDSATIIFAGNKLDAMTDHEVDEVIVHELLHIVFRDLEEAHDSVKGELHPWIRDSWSERIEHETEGIVEKLARALVSTST
jgi:hypothetical protein